ncbi:hypothetical protein Tco_1059395 [Tanacetum coccineum]
MVAIICRLSSHLVSRRTTRAFVPALLRWRTRFARLSLNISSCLSGSTTVSRVRLNSVIDAWSSGRSFPLMEKLSSLLAKLDIESSRIADWRGLCDSDSADEEFKIN